MFASQTIDTVTIPGEPPVVVTFHKLSGKDLEAAQFEHMTGVATGRGRNWATRFVAIAEKGIAAAADAERVYRDPLAGYDRLTLAKAGITAWTCVDAKGEPVKVTAAAIDDLEDEALETIALAILKLTKPGLFLTPEDAAEEKKSA